MRNTKQKYSHEFLHLITYIHLFYKIAVWKTNLRVSFSDSHKMLRSLHFSVLHCFCCLLSKKNQIS